MRKRAETERLKTEHLMIVIRAPMQPAPAGREMVC